MVVSAARCAIVIDRIPNSNGRGRLFEPDTRMGKENNPLTGVHPSLGLKVDYCMSDPVLYWFYFLFCFVCVGLLIRCD